MKNKNYENLNDDELHEKFKKKLYTEKDKYKNPLEFDEWKRKKDRYNMLVKRLIKEEEEEKMKKNNIYERETSDDNENIKYNNEKA